MSRVLLVFVIFCVNAHASTALLPERCTKFLEQRQPAEEPPPANLLGTYSRPEEMDFSHEISLKLEMGTPKSVPFVDAELKREECQTMRGFGFGVTSATVINYQKLPAEKRKEVMEQLFSSKSGAGLSYLVLPLSSTDFNDPTAADYSICDCGAKKPSKKSSCFSPEPFADQVHFIQEATKINPNIKLMIKPWTSPPHMKVAKSFPEATPYRGGDFDIEWSESYASCLTQATEWLDKKGLKVKSVSVQNEPGLRMPYPSVFMSNAVQARLLDLLDGKMKKKFPDTQLVVRADNFNSVNDVKKTLALMKTKPNNLIFAAHCYAGKPAEAKGLLPKRTAMFCGGSKTMEYMLGECTGHTQVGKSDFSWWMDQRVFVDTAMGSTGTLAWNGILDEKFGPKNAGCQNCRGLATTDFSKTPAQVTWNPEFHALKHASRFIQDGAKRLIAEDELEPGLRQILFRNPDGTVAGIFHNISNENKKFRLITKDCRESEVDIAGKSVVSLAWK